MNKTDEKKLHEIIKQATHIHDAIVGLLKNKITTTSPDSLIKIVSRIKTEESATEKIKTKREEGKKEYGPQDITDIIGIRFICHFNSDIEDTVKVLLNLIKSKTGFEKFHERARLYTTTAPNQFTLIKIIEATFKEAGFKITTIEKESRYTSLHIVCRLKDYPNFPPIEIQIRNVFEDAWSSLEHAVAYKGKSPISPGVRRHLDVLNSLIQTCVEYTEAIKTDHSGKARRTTEVSSLKASKEELSTLQPIFKSLLEDINKLREEGDDQGILTLIEEWRKSPPSENMNGDGDYFIKMEEAFALLKLGHTSQAKDIYGHLLKSHPRRELIHFRMASAHSTEGAFSSALACIQDAEEAVKASGPSLSRERKYVSDMLPLTKSYYYWCTNEKERALSTLKAVYAKKENNKDINLRKKYLNSMVYYELETTSSDNLPLDKLRKYVSKMEEFKMNSTQTEDPAFVDTYAWLCHKLGEKAKALKSIQEVISCLSYLPNGQAILTSAKKDRRHLSLHAIESITMHAREIFSS